MSFASIQVHLLQRFSLNFSANILSAFLMLMGSVRTFFWVKPSFAQFMCFLTTALLANVLFSWLVADVGSVFNTQGLISYLVWPMIMLLAGMIISRRSGNYALMFVPSVLWLTADTFLMLVQSLLQFLATQEMLPAWAYKVMPWLFLWLFVWQTAMLLLVFAKKLHWRWWERTLMLFGAIVLLGVWQQNVANQPIFKLDDPVISLDETLFYTQANLFAQTLADIKAGQVGKADWYFLGLAGYSGQDVFANEINTAHRLFDEQFGTQGRSVALINNPSTWQTAPIATTTSLAQTLATMGKKMNVDEDVLFLSLSSHGMVDENDKPIGDLVIDNPPIKAKPIDPIWLRHALDDSGIRWRVIVVSACYSGVFVEPLMTPTTLVITASRADRASFGCTNDADLTYFGRAFFEQSLPHLNGFEQVFAHAKERIGEREALMGFVPSEPQMAIGDLMKTALPSLEQSLFAKPLQVSSNQQGVNR